MPVLTLARDSTIAGAAFPVAAVVALAAGFVSFASPCVLPLVPGFLGYVTGLSGAEVGGRRRSRLILGTLLFVLGFSAVFTVTIVTASAVSLLLREHQDVLVRLGGAVVLVLALVFLGFGGRFGMQREFRLRWQPVSGLAGAPLLGAVFGVGWAPCTGPTLAAILALTAPLGGDGAIARGLALSAAYCMGLGVPFILLAAGWSRAGRASAWLRRHVRGVQLLGGGLLLVVGLLMVSGLWVTWTTWLQAHLVAGFVTVL